MPFEVKFYTPRDKQSPIQIFLDGCQPNLRSKILRQLLYLQEYGINKAIPNLRKIAGTSLWEIRILGKDNIRLMCQPASDKVIRVLLFSGRNLKKHRKKN